MQSGIAPGRRICVVGTSGSGKTYVAQALAKRLSSITYISNDAIIRRPNWVPTPDDARLAASDAATRLSAWTFDGNLSLCRAEDRLVLDRCDTVVWLDLPRWQVWSQVIWRTLRRYVTREELWHGNRESLRITFSRNSIAWWSVKTFSKRRREYTQLFADPAQATKMRIRLSSRGETNRWLQSPGRGLSLRA
ncbi:MAG TPA: adenylate kinase [Dehalococcoidia bacterium]|nr:adenylate kinase [Dehalococcoidia bacterium]